MTSKTGYKQTEVGIIPEDWSVYRFGDTTAFVGSGKSKKRSAAGSFPMFGSTGIIGFTNIPDYSGRAILVARVGANAGTINLVSGRYSVTDNTIIIRLDKGVDPIFSYYVLKRSQLNSLVFGSGQPLITGTQLKALPVAAPKTIEEQRAIAAALSDADEWIASLDRLIAKKRDIKQAAMQQLLTGKTRLPGFEKKPGYRETEVGGIPEDWSARRIGDVCQIFGRIGFRGYTVDDIVEEGRGAISLSPSNIQGDQLELTRNTYISWEKWKESAEIQIENGDIILVKTGSTVGKAAIVKNLNVPATLNPQMVVLKKRRIDDGFLGYVVISKGFQDQLTSTVVGGALPTLSQKEVATYRFPCPNSPDEQRSIAAVLSDIDAKLDALEAKRNKARAIKQGMMQELLTGRIRLI
ncbi:MAG: restriction endonuclease subunit S [Rhodomicrobium sp.]